MAEVFVLVSAEILFDSWHLFWNHSIGTTAVSFKPYFIIRGSWVVQCSLKSYSFLIKVPVVIPNVLLNFPVFNFAVPWQH